MPTKSEPNAPKPVTLPRGTIAEIIRLSLTIAAVNAYFDAMKNNAAVIAGLVTSKYAIRRKADGITVSAGKLIAKCVPASVPASAYQVYPMAKWFCDLHKDKFELIIAGEAPKAAKKVSDLTPAERIERANKLLADYKRLTQIPTTDDKK